MINIMVSETGFVSGQAWETIGYEGELGSRQIHTSFHMPCESECTTCIAQSSYDSRCNTDCYSQTITGCKHLRCPKIPINFTDLDVGYFIHSDILNRTDEILLDEDSNIVIPAEFMSNSGKLRCQFFIRDSDVYLMKSNVFNLTIDSSLGPGEIVCTKPDANHALSVDTILERDSIPRTLLANGKLVRVADVNGSPAYYTWDNATCQWVAEIFGVGTITINDVQGLTDALSWHDIAQ